MNHPTYEQQWQKITEAYMRDEIRPYDARFCFCGTLCDNSTGWQGEDSGIYTYHHFSLMEFHLLESIRISTYPDGGLYMYGEYFDTKHLRNKVFDHPNYETALFNGMVAALEVLRQTHLAKGDETAQPITLQKRTLCAAQ